MVICGEHDNNDNTLLPLKYAFPVVAFTFRSELVSRVLAAQGAMCRGYEEAEGERRDKAKSIERRKQKKTACNAKKPKFVEAEFYVTKRSFA